MKYIKTYEEIDNFTARPKTGDYIYIKANEIKDFSLSEDEKEDAKTRIFQILEVEHQLNDLLYKIKSVPQEGRPKYNKWYIFSEKIECFAPTIKELKIKHDALKYNI